MTSVLTKKMTKKRSIAFAKSLSTKRRGPSKHNQVERTLLQSEEHYRTLIEESFDGVFIQKGTKIVFANQRLNDMLGYIRGEMEGMDHWLVYHPDYQELTRERAQARMLGKIIPPQYEVKLLRKDGSSFEGEINAKAIRLGNEPGIQVWVRDITERKQAEETLKRNEGESKIVAQESRVIAEIGQIISSTLNIDEVYERFAEELGKLIPIDRITINIVNSRDNTTMTAYVSGGELSHRMKGSVYPSAGTFTEEVTLTRKSFLIHEKNYKEYCDRFPGFALSFEAGFRSLILVPLISKDEVIGVLQLRSKKPNAYSEKDLRLAERVGHQIAGAIANAQLFVERNKAEEALRKSGETARRLSQDNVIVAEIGRIISSTLNIDEVYERFAKEVGKLIPIDRIAINIINHRDNTTIAAYIAGGELPHRLKGSVYPSVGTITEEVKRTRTSFLIHEENYKECLDRFPGFTLYFEAGFRSLVLIPLLSKDEVVGVLQLYSKKPNAYSEEGLRLAERVGHQIAGAIANAQLFADRKKMEEDLKESELSAKQLAQENELIGEIGQIISSTLNIEEVYGRFAEEVRKLVHSERLAINVINPKDHTFTVPYISGVYVEERRAGTVLPLASTFTEEVMVTRSNIIIQGEKLKGYLDRFPGLLSSYKVGLQSYLSVPLISKDQVIGVLHFRTTEANAYTERDIRLAERVGNQIAGAIANAQLFKDLKQAEETIRRSREFAETVFNSMNDSISIIDVHNFKIIDVNQSFLKKLRMKKDEVLGKACYEITHHRSDPCTPPDDICPLLDTIKTGQPSVTEHIHYDKDGEKAYMEVTTSPIKVKKGEIIQAVHVAKDITERKQAEEEQRKLILELQEALLKVKTLKGLIPICASCKKIRDDKGYWNQLETYFHHHSEAEFSHGICPECCKKLYPDLYDEEKAKE